MAVSNIKSEINKNNYSKSGGNIMNVVISNEEKTAAEKIAFTHKQSS